MQDSRSIAEPRVLQMYRYWVSKRQSRSMPRRGDIDPIDIPRLLPHILLTDVEEAPRRYRYRLAGTQISTVLGIDPSGRYIREVLSGRYLEFVEGLHRLVCEERVPIYSESVYPDDTGPTVVTSRLMLPLSDDDRVVNKIVGIQIFQSKASFQPTIALERVSASATHVIDVCRIDPPEVASPDDGAAAG